MEMVEQVERPEVASDDVYRTLEIAIERRLASGPDETMARNLSHLRRRAPIRAREWFRELGVTCPEVSS